LRLKLASETAGYKISMALRVSGANGPPVEDPGGVKDRIGILVAMEI
jgi:hypothetical protein